MRLADLNILDLRNDIPHAKKVIGTRPGDPTGATLHYNGPAVKDRTHAGEIAQLIVDANWHMRKDAFGPGAAGDGLQYCFAVLSDGTIAQCRDLPRVLWHCANADGNMWSISTHLPLGGTQDALEVQWTSWCNLADALAGEYGFARSQVLGHREWPKFVRNAAGKLVQVANSACPGPILMKRLQRWRALSPISTWKVVDPTGANVRQGPGRQFPIALNKKAVFPLGFEFEVDTLTIGERINGTNEWLHTLSGVGFVHPSTCVQLA